MNVVNVLLPLLIKVETISAHDNKGNKINKTMQLNLIRGV